MGELQMIKKKILVDDTKRELCAHGSETFPMTVNHDDLWMFEGKNVPIHWHNELEISLPVWERPDTRSIRKTMKYIREKACF